MASAVSHLRRNLVAYLALFVALSTTGYAASGKLLPRNSVGTRQVIDNSLLLKDFNKSQRAKLRGPRGFLGAQGPQGTQGVPGPQGLQGPEGPPNPNAVNAQNADKLDGLDSTAFFTRGTGKRGGTVEVPNCNTPDGVTLVSYSIVLDRPGRIFVNAFATLSIGGSEHPSLQAVLVNSVSEVVAQTQMVIYYGPTTGFPTLSVSAMLFSAGPAQPVVPYDAPAGTYTLDLIGNATGPCTGGSNQYQFPELSDFVVSTLP
jgi:hypothetical protein